MEETKHIQIQKSDKDIMIECIHMAIDCQHLCYDSTDKILALAEQMYQAIKDKEEN